MREKPEVSGIIVSILGGFVFGFLTRFLETMEVSDYGEVAVITFYVTQFLFYASIAFLLICLFELVMRLIRGH